MIDWDRILQLQAEIGGQEFGPLTELFLDEIELRLMRLGTTPTQKLLDLHFLRGSALNMGFVDFAALCLTSEAALRDRQGGLRAQELQDSFAATKQNFSRELPRILGQAPSHSAGVA